MRKHCACWIAVVWAVAACSLAPAAERKPNIVILLADDLGYADVGFHGCRDIPTPHIDSIARSGVRFPQGYVSGPVCSPTRKGLLTGRYQNRFGHEFNLGNHPDAESQELPLSESTIAQRLKAAGYATGAVGKWHLGVPPQFQPQRRGFDEFFGFLEGGHSYFPGDERPLYRGTQPVKDPDYLTDAFAHEAVDFIDRHRQHPFFLYLAFNAVHTPMHATDARLQRFASIADERRRTYVAMLLAMDEAVGRVLDKLCSAGLERETLIVFLNDNGGPTMPGVTVNGSNNAPLRGSKRTTLEGGIRVPFVVQWTGTLPADTVYEHPVIQLDILPTALAAAGVEPQADWKLDGVNLLPYLTGKTSGVPHDSLFWRFGTQFAVRHGDWKLVAYDPQAESTTVIGDICFTNDPVGPPRLYNLAEDLGETRDLAELQPAKVAELTALWKTWNEELQPPQSDDQPR